MKKMMIFLIPMLLIFFVLSSQIFGKDLSAFIFTGIISIIFGSIIGLIVQLIIQLTKPSKKKNL
ncbi:hypothetical protein C1N83_27535 (plasmid) [Priestia aryabhattai]|nr:hypothetical protein VL11_02595 [Priestia aryabhattai]KMN93097.1 hypothetical protein ABV89_26015 [Priestia aryabhattai]